MMLTTDARTGNDGDVLKDSWDTIVIGGGQAGLVTGYYLRQSGRDFVILDANEKTGDSWRNRWDLLRLFTPSWANRLPGMPFPGSAEHFPSKDEVADLLLNYKQKFDLPVFYGHLVRPAPTLNQKYPHLPHTSTTQYCNCIHRPTPIPKTLPTVMCWW